MKPEPTARASNPHTTSPKWVEGKKVFASLIDGADVAMLSRDELVSALFYSSTVLFPPAGGAKVKAALKAEAKKRAVLG